MYFPEVKDSGMQAAIKLWDAVTVGGRGIGGTMRGEDAFTGALPEQHQDLHMQSAVTILTRTGWHPES